MMMPSFRSYYTTAVKNAIRRTDTNYYDWRDRLVASKQGITDNENDGTNRPIVYTTYDNLDETVLVQRYEGDGVSLSTVNGVPQPPDPSLLRAQTAYAYDDQGRVYLHLVYDVDPSTGTVSSTALTTNYYYDHRGDQLAESDPGGLWTKDVYDGAGRLVVAYTTDGGGGTTGRTQPAWPMISCWSRPRRSTMGTATRLKALTGSASTMPPARERWAIPRAPRPPGTGLLHRVLLRCG